jgi:hypothetical protein
MKKIVFVLLTILGLVQITKADTIDYWHVYYNKVKIHEFNQIGTHDIILKLNKIRNTDVITITYFRDTPCSDCTTYLTVTNNNRVIVTSSGKGTGNPISFSIKDLVALKKNNTKNVFEIYYTEGKNKKEI